MITSDLSGHSSSPVPRWKFGLDELGADLEALRDKLGIKEAYFAGDFLGGMIGPASARFHERKVLSLSLSKTAAFRTEKYGAKV